MALLSSTELLLVSDNDFGVTGATTPFWRVRLAPPPERHGLKCCPQDPCTSIAVDGVATRNFQWTSTTCYRTAV